MKFDAFSWEREALAVYLPWRYLIYNHTGILCKLCIVQDVLDIQARKCMQYILQKRKSMTWKTKQNLLYSRFYFETKMVYYNLFD